MNLHLYRTKDDLYSNDPAPVMFSGLSFTRESVPRAVMSRTGELYELKDHNSHDAAYLLTSWLRRVHLLYVVKAHYLLENTYGKTGDVVYSRQQHGSIVRDWLVMSLTLSSLVGVLFIGIAFDDGVGLGQRGTRLEAYESCKTIIAARTQGVSVDDLCDLILADLQDTAPVVRSEAERVSRE